MKTNHLLAIALAVTSVACGIRTSFTPTNVPPHPLSPRPESSVEMFTSGTPKRPYVEVGLVSSEHAGYWSSATDSEVMLGLRKQGAEFGCDAVVVTAETGRVVGSYGGGNVNTYTLKNFRAVCAVYTDTDTAAPAPSSLHAQAEEAR